MEIDAPQAPVFTFPPPPPPPRLKYEVVPEPPKRGSRGLKIIDVFLGLALFAFIVLAVVGTYSGWHPQTTASSHGQVQPSCPASLQTFATCWGLNLPASGEWVRWITPTSMPNTITSVKGVEARGCAGEAYDLGKGGNKINGSCGYIDYHSTDRQTHSVYIGVK